MKLKDFIFMGENYTATKQDKLYLVLAGVTIILYCII